MYTQEFTSSGTFTAPSGVTRVWVLACAGGSGGTSGSTLMGNLPQRTEEPMTFLLSLKMIDVTPNTSYTVTIGAGGAGAAANSSFTLGTPGGNTYFGDVIWYGQNTGSVATTGVNSIVQADWNPAQSNAHYASGSNGSVSGSYYGGAGTPGNSFDAGVSGGNGNNAGAGGNGSNATHPGGNGGNGGSGSSTGGAGGNGYKGYAIVMWVD